MHFPILVAGLLALNLVATGSVQAQDEAHLRKALEGKRITLKMDMPATSEGVDVYPGTNRPVDYDKVGKRMKKEGIALKDGEAARITKVKVKGNHIEIQLNGGGFGTFGDALGQLKHQNADSGTAQQMRFQNQRTEKLAGGSRFNLRYPNGVDSDDATAAAVIRALEEYATFPAGIATTVVTHGSHSQGSGGVSDPAGSAGSVRKGMSAEEVAASVGAPGSTSTNGPMTTNRYRTANGSVEVDFVNDVAVGIRQLPLSGGHGLRKGLSVAEVEQIAGKPTATATNNQMVTNKYNWQDGILEADFFNGVLVAYRTSSR